MKLISQLKPKKGKVGKAVIGIVLGGILVWSLNVFIRGEGSRFLELLMLLLAIGAVYLALRGRKEFLIILSGFLATAYIFNLLDFGFIVSWLGTVIFILVYLFLFFAFHLQDWGEILADKWRERAVYVGLVALIMTEFFLILKFFPVDGKNRAIILTLVFWYFNQIYYYHIRRQLKTGVMINLTAAFLIIFGVITYSLPFLGR